MTPSTQPRPRRSSALLLMVVTSLLAALTLGTTPAATAAGSGVLALEITPVNLTNGATITDARDGTNGNRVSYRVAFSCTTAACDGTQVQMSPAPPDPRGLLPSGEWILEYASWAAPATGGTIGGTDVTGKLINLGNLPAGTSGTFSVTYEHQTLLGSEVPNGSFYPEGFKIAMSATATSSTAVAPVTATAADVTWHIGTPTGPSVNLSTANNASTFRTDVPVTYRVAVNAGNMSLSNSCLVGRADVVAAGSYRVVYNLPPQAVIQSATDGGVVDNVNHTVTWTSGTPLTPSYGARGAFGWSMPGGYNCGGGATNNPLRPTTEDDAFWRARQVVVTYPGENFPEADANGCNFTANITNRVDVDVTYLDASDTQKSTSQAVAGSVACSSPFGGLRANKRVSGGVDNQNGAGDGAIGAGDVYALNATAPGETDPGNRSWMVEVTNQGNVDGVAVVEEPNLVQDHLKVYRIVAGGYVAPTATPAGWRATVEWVDNTGATGTATLTNGQSVDAAPGRWFVSARTTMPVAAGRILPTDATGVTGVLFYRFRVDDSAPIGSSVTNTAQVRLDYPEDADGDGQADAYTDLSGAALPSRSISASPARTVRYTEPAPKLTASFTAPPAVAGGGNPKIGTEVTYSMSATTGDVWPGDQIRPQLVFLAPAGWDVVPGSAQFTANGQGQTTTAPPGVTFEYATRTVGGVARQVVVATWPSLVSPSSMSDENWPTLSVRAAPTSTAVAGANVSAQVWAGDASGAWSTLAGASYITRPTDYRPGGAVLDAPDVDADGNSTEAYSSASSAGVIVAATDAIRMVKELCVPDASATDGCRWVSDPTQRAGVPVDATDVQYRITITNSGNTTLTNVVAYDVLPYPGDTGLLANPPARGSEFAMTLASVGTPPAGVTVDYSASTNPARPEVNPEATGTVNDWGAGAAGKKALRIRVAGSLAPNTSRRVVFTAAVSPGARADQVACNTAAVDSAQTLPVEPLPVCVELAEADLAVTAGPLAPWEVDDATTVPFTVVNHGGSAGAGATVGLDVPAGLRVDGLAPAGWRCAAPGGAAAPLAGPVTLSCVPVDGGGSVRTLGVDQPEQLRLAVTPTAVSATPVCVVATISGPMYDRVLSNNEDDACQPIAPVFVPAPSLSIDKSSVFATDRNGNGLADVGDVLTYTFRVSNTGNVGIDDVVIDDAKVASITPASVDIGAGLSAEFTATYTVTQADVDAGGTRNTAAAEGTATSGGVVRSDPDTDVVPGPDPQAAVSVVKSAVITTDRGTAGKADVDDVVTYTFTVRNAGPGTAHDVSVSDPLRGLSAVSPATVATIAPGGRAEFTATYRVTQADVDRGVITNQAVATYSDPMPRGGPVPAPETVDSNEVQVDAAPPGPALSIDKSSVFATDANGDSLADKGDVLTYTFRVVNTGNVTLTGVTVDDDLPGLSAITPAPVTLAPGAAQDFTASYTVRQSDVDAGGTHNEATATGTPPTGPPVTSDPDVDEVDGPVTPGRVSVVKSAALTTDNGTVGKADAGDVITYTFVVTNDGLATASTVTVRDPLKGLSPVTPASVPSLAPGGTAAFSATYTVTAADVTAGVVTNQASATYTPPTPRGGPQPQRVTTPSNVVETRTAPLAPTAPMTPTEFNLTLDKRAVSGAKAVVGDKVRYRLQVANKGPGAATVPIMVKDPLPAGLQLVAARGKGWSCTANKATDRAVCVRDQDLASGAKTSPLLVIARATAAATGKVVNVAKVTAAGDRVRSDDRDVAGVRVEAVPALPDTGFRVALPRW